MPTHEPEDHIREPADGADRGISRRRFAGLLGATGAGVAAAMAPAWTPANASRERPFEPRHHGGGRLPQPNILVILADDLGWADLVQLRRAADPHAQHRPPRRLRRALHRRLLGLVGLLADALRPLHRPLSGPSRRRPEGADLDAERDRRHTAGPSDARVAVEGARLRDGADRQVALRLPAVVQSRRGSAGTASSATSPAASTTSPRSTTTAPTTSTRTRSSTETCATTPGS